MYNDISKADRGTGAGVYCEQIGVTRSQRLEDSCRVFQTNISAILLAAESPIDANLADRNKPAKPKVLVQLAALVIRTSYRGDIFAIS